MAVDYDLIVIGAGIAGLNALHAASRRLPSDANVLLVDDKHEAGGMWNTAYDYVRMHQPHPFFTAGNIAWDWDKPRDYLATGSEVQQHLCYCLVKLSETLQIEAKFGHRAAYMREVQRNGAWVAEVDFHPVNDPGSTQTVCAHRVVDAAGYSIQPVDPLRLSSSRILSVTPETLSATLKAHPTAPTYVVGGGKTGMDTVLEIHRDNPAREVVLINGKGTSYMSRDTVFPTGLKRWFGGKLSGELIHDCALLFDGDNEDQVRGHFIKTYTPGQDIRNQNHIWGILSEDENRRIDSSLSEKLWDYLSDVKDAEAGPEITLRSGERRPVSEGSIFVNCTGGFIVGRTDGPVRPCLSPNDAILSINTREAMHILTTYSSFFLSNLFLSNRLRGAGLFFLDLEDLFRKDRRALTAATQSQSLHNMLRGLRALPAEGRGQFGLDGNMWFPLPRRLLALNRIRKTAREDVRHCRAALERVVERFNIRGGTLLEEDRP